MMGEGQKGRTNTSDAWDSRCLFRAAALFATLACLARGATLAQLVEQLIRNQQVVGSNPTGGSR